MAKTFSIRIRPTSMRGQVLLVVDAIDENGKHLPEYISQQMPQDFAEMVKEMHEAIYKGDPGAKLKAMRMMGQVEKDNFGQFILYSDVYAPGCKPED